MKKAIIRELLLIISIVKWAVIAAIVGIITGSFTTLFLKTLDFSTNHMKQYTYYFLALPIVLFISSYLIETFTGSKENQDSQILETLNIRFGKIKLRMVPVKFLATIITLVGGGSAGKSGPSAQMGAGLAIGLGDIFKLNKTDKSKIVICGISAGFASILGAPIASAIFTVEVLVMGRVLNKYLFPALISAFVAYHTVTYFGMDKYYIHSLIKVDDAVYPHTYIESIFLGVIIGFVALLFIESLKYTEHLANKLNWYKPLKGLLGGLILIILALIFKNEYLGLGMDEIQLTLQGKRVILIAFLIKILFTSITLNMGGSGGIITPIIFIGVTAGSAFAQILQLDNLSLFAAIGFVALLSASANTPIAAIIMSIELFGMEIAPYAAIACIVSYIISGHQSVYLSQVFGSLKHDPNKLDDDDYKVGYRIYDNDLT